MSFLTVCLSPAFQKTLRFASVIPGTVNRTAVHRLDTAGKGINVTRVLNQMGKKAVHLTQLGGPMRPLFLSLCAEDSLSLEWVESYSPVRFCYTLIDGPRSSVTELVEEACPVEAGTEQRLLEKFDSLSPGHNCLIISGSRTAGFSGDLIPLMVQKGKKNGLAVILDIKGLDLINSLPYGPDIIKPNLFEFALTFAPQLIKNNDLLNDENAVRERIQSEAAALCEKYNCRIILTRGSEKIWAAEPGRFFEAAFNPVTPVNVTGSGDAFTAGLAAALDDGADFAAAIAEGIRYGALNALCFRPGVIRETPLCGEESPGGK
ncbi:MAG: PfkB family carbohydrate kinase [Treponema sp.]|jgi:1-phosphofructokinase/tagatose 6-phosphate kinase|nr:PfkB family carbohydrate kinase [Treponema sp.]